MLVLKYFGAWVVRARNRRRNGEQPAATDASDTAANTPEPEPGPSGDEEAEVPGAMPQLGPSTAARVSGERVGVPVLYLSGAVVRTAVLDELGLRPCTFTPTFASKLSNQFHCYTNYESELLGPFLPDDGDEGRSQENRDGEA